MTVLPFDGPQVSSVNEVGGEWLRVCASVGGGGPFELLPPPLNLSPHLMDPQTAEIGEHPGRTTWMHDILEPTYI